MKKVTVILSMFVIGFTSNSFAQNSPATKISNGNKEANPILICLLLPAVKDNNVPAAKSNETPKPIGQAVQPKKAAADYFLKIGVKNR